jgi:hypothetical protein
MLAGVAIGAPRITTRVRNVVSNPLHDAAPDLLAALRGAVGYVPMGNPAWTDRALAAIAKATGE